MDEAAAGRMTADVKGAEVIMTDGLAVEVMKGLGVVQVVAPGGAVVMSETNGVVTGL